MSEMEIFEKLLAMVGAAGEGAFWLAILWIIKDYFMYAITALTVLSIAFFITKAIRDYSAHESFMQEIASQFDMSLPLYDREKKEILDRIRNFRNR